MDIDILCKVVDNYGDIGVAYRLARSLSELPEPPRLRLVVDDLASFAALCPAVDPFSHRQLVHGWEVFCWDGPGAAAASGAFRARRPRVVIECFACGRPEWLEDILFDDSGEGCLIVDLEHLTAEGWAGDFHRMPSLTRSPLVRKAMFLPGFGPETGGLILDGSFVRARERAASEDGRADLRRELLEKLECGAAGLQSAAGARPSAAVGSFWMAVFGYERDYSRVVADMAAFHGGTVGPLRKPLLALVAAGKSQECFLRAWESALRPFPAFRLPFLAQETWDELLLACDFSIVRGEDSWSRAALCGRPFLWQAYPQEGRQQMVKVRAFLERLKPHFVAGAGAAAFPALEALHLAFNDHDLDGAGEGGRESLLPVLEGQTSLLQGFRAFSDSVAGGVIRAAVPATGLAANLLTFLCDIV